MHVERETTTLNVRYDVLFALEEFRDSQTAALAIKKQKQRQKIDKN